jgi:4-hydroxybenzoyl-CoA thioesterase
VCKRLDALGVGVISAQSCFRRPARDGDMLVYTPQIADWREREIHIAYSVTCRGELIAEVSEVRGIFRKGERGIFAAETSGLRLMVEEFERG